MIYGTGPSPACRRRPPAGSFPRRSSQAPHSSVQSWAAPWLAEGSRRRLLVRQSRRDCASSARGRRAAKTLTRARSRHPPVRSVASAAMLSNFTFRLLVYGLSGSMVTTDLVAALGCPRSVLDESFVWFARYSPSPHVLTQVIGDYGFLICGVWGELSRYVRPDGWGRHSSDIAGPFTQVTRVRAARETAISW